MSEVLSGEQIESIRESQKGILKKHPETLNQVVYKAIQGLLATIDHLNIRLESKDNIIKMYEKDIELLMKHGGKDD